MKQLQGDINGLRSAVGGESNMVQFDNMIILEYYRKSQRKKTNKFIGEKVKAYEQNLLILLTVKSLLP